MAAALSASVLSPAGPVAGALAEIAWVLIVGAALVFAIVMGLLLWTLLRRRRRASHDERQLLRRWIVGGGLAFPATVLAALLAYATLRTAALSPEPQPGAPIISVQARMWWWEVRYHDPAHGADVTLANEVHVPVGRTVTLGLSSADVIHSFWVPALAGKMDMLPGRVHQLRIHADRPGIFRGQCAEFCGEQHARMAFHVVAHAPEDYARWLAAQARPAAAPTDALAVRGRQVFDALRCAACHSVRGLGPGSTIGPDLTHLGSRLHLGAGTLPTSRAALAQWVAHSHHAKPGVRMPSYAHLDDASLQALAAFLEQLR